MVKMKRKKKGSGGIRIKQRVFHNGNRTTIITRGTNGDEKMTVVQEMPTSDYNRALKNESTRRD